jgi:hypothetical protein
VSTRIRALAASIVSGPTVTGLSQNRQHASGRDAVNALAFQDPGDTRLTDAHRLVRRWHEFPQIKEPFAVEVLLKFEHRGKIAPPLVAEPVRLRSRLHSALRSAVIRDHSRSSKTNGSESLSTCRHTPQKEWNNCVFPQQIRR